MTCPIEARLAAAAAGEDADAARHARDCLRCRSVLDDQRDVIAAARGLATPPLGADRRAALAAEVMARSDFGPQHWRDTRVWLAGIVLAAAALVLVLGSSVRSTSLPLAPELATSEEPPIEVVERASVERAPVVVPVPRRAEIVASDADFARERRGQQDIVELRDGELAIDTRDREPVTVVAGDTHITITRARVHVVARTGVIVAARVFAGSAEITNAGKREVIDAGMVWTRESPREPITKSEPSPSLTAFRTGWEALRANRYTDAIAAFDRATDPVVAEDAAFWSAIASERGGDHDDAAKRLRAFITGFPTSVRIEAARSALDRVSR